MSQEKKQRVARAAIGFIEDDMVVGVGTGSTVNCFIDELARIRHRIDAAVASSVATETRLRQHNIPVIDLNGVRELGPFMWTAPMKPHGTCSLSRAVAAP